MEITHKSINRLEHFRYVDLPPVFNINRLVNALTTLHKRMHDNEYGKTIDFVSHETHWSNCCYGYVDPDGYLYLGLLYNIGKSTFSVTDTFDIA